MKERGCAGWAQLVSRIITAPQTAVMDSRMPDALAISSAVVAARYLHRAHLQFFADCSVDYFCAERRDARAKNKTLRWASGARGRTQFDRVR